MGERMTYEEQRRVLIDYLRAKVDLGDWHGVSDAANDLREIEAAERVRAQVRWSDAHHPIDSLRVG